MANNNTISLSRLSRTSDSEVWLIDLVDTRIGTLHLHFSTYALGSIILEETINPEDFDSIYSQIEERLVDWMHPREDFILSIYKSKEIAFYSDIVDHELNLPTKKDLKEHKNLIQNVLSKYQYTRGQLNEHVVKQYFENLGFTSKKATPDLDKLKVDILAESNERIIFCQVKLGKVSDRILFNVSKSVSNIPIKTSKPITIAIVGQSFPHNVELIKEEILKTYGFTVWTITKEQILSVLPEYKKTLR